MIVVCALLAFSVLTVSAGEWAVNTFQTAAFATGAAGAIVAWWKRAELRWSPAVLLPAGVCATALIQVVAGWTAFPSATLNAALGWAALTALFAVSQQLLADADVRRRFLRVVACAGFAIAVASVIQTYACPGKVFCIAPTQYQEEVYGPFVNKDHFCAFLELILPILLWLVFRERRRWAVYSVMAGATYAAVIATASRGGAILATGEIIVVTVLVLRTGRSYPRAAIAGIVTTAALFTAVAGWQRLWERFSDPDPFAYRREAAMSSLNMTRDHLWTGTGMGTWATVYPRYALFDPGEKFNHAHNDWLEWTAEGGVGVAVLFVAFFGWVCWKSLHAPWASGLAFVLLHSLVDFPLQKMGLLAVVIVLAAAVANQRQMPFDRNPAPLTAP